MIDLGGTWFRSALLAADGRLVGLERQRAASATNRSSAPVGRLQADLVDYVISEAARIGRLSGSAPPICGVSLGAALNAHTGWAVGSGPLWGAAANPFHLERAVRDRAPELRLAVINDVTAAALEVSAGLDATQCKKLSVVAVSTGIALRTIEVATGRVPVDGTHGLQGEIGHLPATCSLDGEQVIQRCDCGEPNHVASFASGRGLMQLAARSVGRHGDFTRVPRGDAELNEHFHDNLRAGDPRALAVLDASTAPLARVLLHAATLDPEVDRVVLVGGVAEKLGERYRASLLASIERDGLYKITDRDPDYFERRIGLGGQEQESCLRGAGRFARQQLVTGRVTAAARWTVRAKRPIRYNVRLVRDVLSPDCDALAQGLRLQPRAVGRRLVVVDDTVDRLYGERLRAYFAARETPVFVYPLRVSEELKTMRAVEQVTCAMHDAGVPRRREPILAVGGGVLMDIVGLAASLYRRGTPYVRVPTTLLGLVDAGVGIKTAINFDSHKSRLGTYHPADASLLDTTFLCSLPRRQLSNGLSEILKVGVMLDRVLFELLERHGHDLLRTHCRHDAIEPTITRAITAMLAELADNLWEEELERAMDFGHSFSPALEMHDHSGLLHGEAVAVDMALSCVLARNRRLLRAEELYRVLRALARCELPITCAGLDDDVLIGALRQTTSHRDGCQRLPLPNGLGDVVFVNDVSDDELCAAAGDLRDLAGREAVAA